MYLGRRLLTAAEAAGLVGCPPPGSHPTPLPPPLSAEEVAALWERRARDRRRRLAAERGEDWTTVR